MSIQPPNAPQRRRWTRSYPPLVLLAIAVLVAVLVLPSALNLPQSNPTTVLEYAPIPPDDNQKTPPQEGNLSTLGLGHSGTIASSTKASPPPLPPPVEQGVGGRPRQFRCVGDPPRQTEDPSSPPCVPFFQGDNFGATYQGVTKAEITVLFYMDSGGYGPASDGEVTPSAGSYVDIDGPPHPACPPTYPGPATNPNDCDHTLVRMLRGFSHYFNDRFNTYGRHVHYWLYVSSSSTAAGRRADAVANWEQLHPFAVIDWAVFNGYNEEYQTAMAQLGVLTFSTTVAGLPNAFYRANAPQSWGFFPDTEHWADLYASYVCTKVKPYNTSHFGNPQGVGAPNGQKRKFGLWYTTDPQEPALQLFSDLVIKKLDACGIDTSEEATFQHSGFAVDGSDTGTDAANAAARFSGDKVTTVLYLGGTETRFSNSADAIRYYPEIVVAGDLENDNNFIGRVQNQNSWQNAWAMTYHVRINRLEDAPGYRAYKEGSPNGDDNAGLFARDEYADHFMLFQGIQVAGPRLTPESMDAGFHAIPEHTSVDPYIPAQFFDQGDYTSVKDAMEAWWDGKGRPPGSNQPGCWRLVRSGRRFLAGAFAGKDDVFKNATDPCTGYGGSINIKP